MRDDKYKIIIKGTGPICDVKIDGNAGWLIPALAGTLLQIFIQHGDGKKELVDYIKNMNEKPQVEEVKKWKK